MLQGLNTQEVNHSTQVLLERSYKPIDPNDTQAESTSSDPGPSTTQSGQDIEILLALQQQQPKLDHITAILDDLVPKMNNLTADLEQLTIHQEHLLTKILRTGSTDIKELQEELDSLKQRVQYIED